MFYAAEHFSKENRFQLNISLFLFMTQTQPKRAKQEQLRWPLRVRLLKKKTRRYQEACGPRC